MIGKMILVILGLVLSGFRVSSLDETDMPFHHTGEKRQASCQGDGNYFTTRVQGKLRSDMPEFSFDIEAYFYEENSKYSIQSVTVREGDRLVQVISVPELSLFGETAVWADDQENMGLELEDVNFDGYKDIRLFDTLNGNYLIEWIYLVWDPDRGQFVHDPRLNEIPLATFDQEDQLIYGMQRGGAARHYFYTYEYQEGEPVMICEEKSIYLPDPDSEAVRRCVHEKLGDGNVQVRDVCRETVEERNPDTGEMEQIRDEFIFFLVKEDGIEETIIVEADSEMGRLLDRDGEF